MADIRRCISGRLTPQQRERHRAIREEVSKEKPLLDAKARAKRAELRSLREALTLLKQARQERGISLAELSARTGIDRGNLSRLENDPNPNPTLDTLTRIAEAIGVKLTIGLAAA